MTRNSLSMRALFFQKNESTRAKPTSMTDIRTLLHLHSRYMADEAHLSNIAAYIDNLMLSRYVAEVDVIMEKCRHDVEYANKVVFEYLDQFSHRCGPQTCGDPTWYDRMHTDHRLTSALVRTVCDRGYNTPLYLRASWSMSCVRYSTLVRDYYKPDHAVHTLARIAEDRCAHERSSECAIACRPCVSTAPHLGCGTSSAPEIPTITYVCKNCLDTIKAYTSA